MLRVPTSRNVAQIRPRIYGFGEVRRGIHMASFHTRQFRPMITTAGGSSETSSAAVRPPSRRGLARRALPTTTGGRAVSSPSCSPTRRRARWPA